jgi:hypothetical protein
MAITKLQPFNLDSTANYTFANITTGNANLGNAATANYFIGSGNNLSNIQSANLSGQVANALVSGTVYTNAQPNITSVGNLTGLTVSNATGVVDFTTTANVTLGTIANVHITGGSSSQYLQTDGVGNLSWSTISSSAISNGTSNVNIPTANGNVNLTAVGNTTMVVTGTGANITGTANVSGTSSFGANVDLNTNSINNLHDPVAAQDAATKNYVDTVAKGLNIHEAAYVATTGNLDTATSGTVSYNNGASGVGANLVTTGTYLLIDGGNVQTVGTRILVKNEANQAWNGVYTYANTTVIVRAIDFDTSTEVNGGDFLFITSGSTQADTGWVQITDNVVIGTSNLVFDQFSGVGTYQAGTGLTLTGQTFSVNVAQPTITSVGNLTGLTVSNATGVVDFTTTANVTLGAVGNLHISGGSSSQYLQTDGVGNLSWSTISSSAISNGTSNVNIPTANGNVNITAAGNTTLVITGTGANVTGTINVSGNANIGAGNVVWDGTNFRINTTKIQLGSNAGVTSQGANAVAIGVNAGNNFQGANSVAIGSLAGANPATVSTNYVSGGEIDTTLIVVDTTGIISGMKISGTGFTSGQTVVSVTDGTTLEISASADSTPSGSLTFVGGQGDNSVAVGLYAGSVLQGTYSVAIGAAAGSTRQGASAVAIGLSAGVGSQGASAVAIGDNAGQDTQGANAVAIGSKAGTYLQSNNAVAIGHLAGAYSQGTYSVAIGYYAGNNTQGIFSVAIGQYAGFDHPGGYTVAIGSSAGRYTQGASAVAIGENAGSNTQGTYSVAIGANAGSNLQGANSVAIGANAGSNTQGTYSVAIGRGVGANTQGASAVAIGDNAGKNTQGSRSVAIGFYAGGGDQSLYSVAIGDQAGTTNQGGNAVAVGPFAGAFDQGANSIAIGARAGQGDQGANSVAIGRYAGGYTQGVNAVAIGANAGYTSQGNNSIIINATGANLEQTTANTFTVAPVRNDTSNIAEVMFYNATSKEVTYGNTISIAGNISAGNVSGNGTVQANNHTVTGAATGNLNVSTITGNLGFRSLASTYTDDSASASGTIALAAVHALAIPTIAASNATVTVTTGATLYVAGAPANSTNITTFTNPYALYVAAGNSFFGGNIIGNLANGNSSVKIPAANGNINLTAVGNTTIVVTGTGANITGTLNVSGNANIGLGNVVWNGTNFRINTTTIQLGANAGVTSQGANSVAIGANAGVTNQAANSIIINATGATLDQTTANTFTVAPIRNDTSNIANALYYNIATSEISYAPPAGGGSTTVVAYPDSATITLNSANTDIGTQTNTQVAGTLTIAAPTGSPTDGQKIMIRLQATNTQTFSFNAVFNGSLDLSLPTTSSNGSKYDYLGFIYNSGATKWNFITRNFGFV